MKKFLLLCLVLISVLTVYSCKDSSSDPSGGNSMGGDINLDYTQVGYHFITGISVEGADMSSTYGIKSSIDVTENNNGIVTYKFSYTFNEKQIRSLDTILGTSEMNVIQKLQVINTYFKIFKVAVDTADLQNIVVVGEFKLRLTSEGIQDFTYSNGDISKPFTMVKYSSNVGNKYQFTTSDGKTITRKVISKAETEDWYLLLMKIKTIKVEEELPDDPVNEKVVYVANHKFGLVGALLYLRNGKQLEYHITPWNE